MLEGARAWLPKGAFSQEAISACLSGPVTDWSRRWFANASAAIAAVRREEEPSHAPAPDRLNVGAYAALEISGRGKRRLLEAALDTDLSDQPLTDSDRSLLDGFTRRMTDDLIARLENTLGNGGDGVPGARIVTTIAIAENDLMTLHMPEQVLTPLIKAYIGRSRVPARTPVRRSEALRRTKLHAHGHIGHAEIGIGELEALSAGDVLILDRALSESVELRLAGNHAALARGRLCRGADQVFIQL